MRGAMQRCAGLKESSGCGSTLVVNDDYRGSFKI